MFFVFSTTSVTSFACCPTVADGHFIQWYSVNNYLSMLYLEAYIFHLPLVWWSVLANSLQFSALIWASCFHNVTTKGPMKVLCNVLLGDITPRHIRWIHSNFNLKILSEKFTQFCPGPKSYMYLVVTEDNTLVVCDHTKWTRQKYLFHKSP